MLDSMGSFLRSFGAVFGFSSVLGPLLGGVFTGKVNLEKMVLTFFAKITSVGAGAYIIHSPLLPT